MSVASLRSEPSRGFGLPVWLGDLAIAVTVVGFIFAFYAWSGFPSLKDPGADNDSMLRLVQVRDLLGGQGWFDPQQYRMGLREGFPMHWSRLIDAPLAGIILVSSWLGASMAMSEKIALVLWPLLLMVAALFGLIRLARMQGSEYTIVPAVVLGAGALYYIGQFSPGTIDHHNAQLALTIGMLTFLVGAPRNRAFPALAGLCAAAMLAIGTETIPYVTVAGGAVALTFLIFGQQERERTLGFALSLAGATLMAFLATVSPARWLTPACDALSSVQLTLAVCGGVGLAFVAWLPATSTTFGRRLGGLAGLALVVVAIARVAFPQCLGDPVGYIDPRLREIWLDNVQEARSVFAVLATDTPTFYGYYITPFIALLVSGWLMARQGMSRGLMIQSGFLLAAFVVCLWQMRGGAFAVPLATTILAVSIGIMRERAANGDTTLANSIAAFAAWLLFLNTNWALAGHIVGGEAAPSAKASPVGTCTEPASFAFLAAQPAALVLAGSDLGSPILLYTPHRVLAGPYHRNVAGMSAMFDAMLGTASEAEAAARKLGVAYVAFCGGAPETANMAKRAPKGLMADLKENRVPAWLSLEPETAGKAVQIYRVVKP